MKIFWFTVALFVVLYVHPCHGKYWHSNRYCIFLNTSRLWINAGLDLTLGVNRAANAINARSWTNAKHGKMAWVSLTCVSPHLPSRGAIPVMPVTSSAGAEATPNSSSNTSCCSFLNISSNLWLSSIFDFLFILSKRLTWPLPDSAHYGPVYMLFY